MQFSTLIDRLEKDIADYRVEYQRFFNGDATLPPEEEWSEIRQRLNHLVGIPQLTQVDRFRLGGLEGRYNSLSELFRRRLREMDYAQGARGGAAGPASVILSATPDLDDVAPLYQQLYADRKTNVALEDFHAYLEKQARKVRQKTGCVRVRFTVRNDGGKRKLRARPASKGISVA